MVGIIMSPHSGNARYTGKDMSVTSGGAIGVGPGN